MCMSPHNSLWMYVGVCYWMMLHPINVKLYCWEWIYNGVFQNLVVASSGLSHVHADVGVCLSLACHWDALTPRSSTQSRRAMVVYKTLSFWRIHSCMFHIFMLHFLSSDISNHLVYLNPGLLLHSTSNSYWDQQMVNRSKSSPHFFSIDAHDNTEEKICPCIHCIATLKSCLTQSVCYFLTGL